MQEKALSDHFSELCKKSGLKITPQRCAVYGLLMTASNHPTADEVYRMVRRRFPNISYDTVNRTLLTFAEIGLVDILQTKGGPRRFDPVMDNHHHFYCVDCGKIIDFTSQQYDDLKIPDQISADCTVFTQRVVLNGLCPQCRKKKRTS
jgi:Fur family peroxide stress response transcriptional regulator